VPIHSERDFENPRLSMWSTTHLVAHNNQVALRMRTHVNHLTCAVPEAVHAKHPDMSKIFPILEQ